MNTSRDGQRRRRSPPALSEFGVFADDADSPTDIAPELPSMHDPKVVGDMSPPQAFPHIFQAATASW